MLLALAREVGPAELLVLAGASALTIGVAQLSTAGAWIAIGLLLLWCALPPRPPFLERRRGKDEL
jgi:hypothetical protein